MGKQFSVIIPLYNKAPFIKRAIDSVLTQTYKDFEIIVVDDGSTDDGVLIVSQISDERLKIIKQKNSGVSATRNKGASLSSTPYLAFLDADDTWEPTFLQTIFEMINTYPNAGIYGTSNYFIYPSGKVFYEDFSELFSGNSMGILEDYFGLFATIKKSPFSNSNLCIPKHVYDRFGGYKTGVKLTEDSDLWCRIAMKYPLAFSILPLAKYYLEIQGSTYTIFEPQEYQVSKTLKLALKNGEVATNLIESVNKLIVFQNLGLVKRALLSGQKKFAFKELLNSKISYYYPREFIECVISVLLPKFIFDKIRGIKNT